MSKNKTKSTLPNKEASEPARAKRLLLRMLWAAQPISRIELARTININRSTATEIFKPLINSGIIVEKPLKSSGAAASVGRPPIGLAFDDSRDFMIGVNLGVRHSQIGATTLGWDFDGGFGCGTPAEPQKVLQGVHDRNKKH